MKMLSQIIQHSKAYYNPTEEFAYLTTKVFSISNEINQILTSNGWSPELISVIEELYNQHSFQERCVQLIYRKSPTDIGSTASQTFSTAENPKLLSRNCFLYI